MVLNKPYSSSMEKEVRKAANIINAFFDSKVDADSAIPVELIKGCAGLAFLTVIKAGLVWTGKVGTGVVIARLEDGSWSPPSGIGTAGIGFGAEIGGEIVDFMIVLGSASALNTFKKGTQVSVGAGLDLAVGPVGRAAGASMNAGSGGLSGNYTYSHAKGMFAGIGLHGSTILVRGDMNAKFYGRDVTPMEILNGHVQPPAGSCDVLYDAIQRITLGVNRSSVDGAYPTYGDYNRNSTSSSGYSASSAAHSTTSLSAAASSSAITNRSSFEQQRGSASAAPASATPDPSDPRLRRYSSYKSEAELYAQFSGQKSAPAQHHTQAGGYAAAGGYQAQPVQASSYTAGYAAAPTGSYPANTGGYAAGAAVGAAGGYAAYNNHPAAYAASAPAPAAPGPALSTHTHPTNPSLKYTSYPAPSPNSAPYVAPAQASYQSAPAPAPVRQQVPPLPSAASGAETKEVYTQVINFVTTRCPYANVQVFKDNCRLFGQDQMSLDAFYSYISSICTRSLMKEFVPQLVRLLPTQEKREMLWTQYCRDVLFLKV
ncbi:hypothetical protein PybrP1_004156 [[Pythium] brassicae (nom. inval.)]|nr:hypothetical protein PybrP1_004156 [[Pythium] brassicae (nom. inval.)]